MPDDFAALLGIAGTDLEANCTSSAINIWSPRKPIYSTKFELTADDFKGGAHTVAGYKTGAGILKRTLSGSEYYNDIGSDGMVSNAIWDYDRPVKDGHCVFRIKDFIGYWHHAGRMFTIGTIYGNVSSIIVPSTQSADGSRLGFSMYFSVQTGTIVPGELFGDCWNYYPTVIMSSGGYRYNYVKSADNPISAYVGTTAYITIYTSDFMRQIASDFRAQHSGDPYSNFPLRTGDKWTACLVLSSRYFSGGDGYDHKLNGNESLVRLEYASPSGDTHVDRRTLPLKQSKYNNIEWMKMVVTITRKGAENGYEKYEITSIKVTAKMLTTDSISFTIGASLSTPQGYVNVVNTASGQSVNIENYSNTTFSGSTGEVEKTLGLSLTTYYVSQNASTGNKLCNGTLTFKNSKGNFSGTFSIDISGQSYQYSREVNLL